MFKKILTSSLLFLIAIGGFFVSAHIDTQNTQIDNTTIKSISFEVSGIYAADSNTPAPESETLKKGIDVFNAALGILTVIVSPAIIFAGWLMSPDWTSGDLFGLREPMHDIWVVVSNIIYFVYAVLLIIIAVATVLGKEQFNYKTMLPRMALGILMVPFTWWFVQWTISLASIVTASTISIPMEMIKEDNPYINGNYIPKYYLTTTDKVDNKSTVTTTDSAENWSYNGKCNGGTEDADICTNIQEILKKGGGIYSPLLIYAYQVFRLQDYKNLEGELNQIKTAGQLLNNIIVGAIMFLVFGILVIALIMVLFVRAIKLWMYAMFSPLFTLHFVAGKELFKDPESSFSLREFVGLCFMPAIVGLTLSFGLMVISVVQSPNTSGQEKCTPTKLQMGGSIEDPTGGCTLISVFGNTENKISRGVWPGNAEKQWSVNVIKIAGLTYVYKGRATNANDILQSTNNITGGLSAAGGIFGTIIIDVIALIFIWMAFMAAKKVNNTIGNVLKPFEEMGTKVGQMAMSAPKYAPLPIPGGSLRGAEMAMGSLENMKNAAAEKRYRESNLGKFIDNMNPELKLSPEAQKAFDSMIISNSTVTEKNVKDMHDALAMIPGKQAQKNTTVSNKLDAFISAVKTDSTATSKLIKNYDKQTADKIKEIADSDFSPEEKRLVIAALMKGNIDYTRVDKADKDATVARARTALESAGSSSSSNSGKGSTSDPTAHPDTNGNGKININGVTINYNGLKLDESAENIGDKVAGIINSKKGEIAKPTKEQVKKIVEDIGVESGKKSEDTIKRILDKLEDDFKKDK